MKIENKALVDDIITIVANGCTYVNTATGEERTAVFESDVAPTLLHSLNHGLAMEGKIRRWKNVSDLKAGDLEDSGFTLLVREDNPNQGVRGDWRLKYVDGSLGRRMGKYQTLITV